MAYAGVILNMGQKHSDFQVSLNIPMKSEFGGVYPVNRCIFRSD